MIGINFWQIFTTVCVQYSTCYPTFILLILDCILLLSNCICGVMVSMLASSVVDSVFKSRSGHIKDYKIGICYFSANHTASRSMSKDWLARNQNNVSEWRDMSISGLLFQWASTIKIQLSVLFVLVRSVISLNITFSHHDIAEKLIILH